MVSAREDSLACGFAQSKGAIFQDLRSAVDIRDSFKRGWRGRRVGHAVAPAEGCQGVQEVFADEVTNEKGGTTEIESKSERGRAGF